VQVTESFPSSNPRLVALVGLGVWIGLCLIAGSYLLARNAVIGPGAPVVQRAITAQRGADQAGRWLVLHVVSEDCTCSRRVLDHLLASTRPWDVVERIVLVSDRASADSEWGPAIRDHGFDFDVVAPEELFARYRIDVAPVMAVIDPHDQVRYVGGYSRCAHGELRDAPVINAVRRGETVEPLPTFGCAIGGTLATAEPLRPHAGRY
jgi:hypothetical protein